MRMRMIWISWLRFLLSLKSGGEIFDRIHESVRVYGGSARIIEMTGGEGEAKGRRKGCLRREGEVKRLDLGEGPLLIYTIDTGWSARNGGDHDNSTEVSWRLPQARCLIIARLNKSPYTCLCSWHNSSTRGLLYNRSTFDLWEGQENRRPGGQLWGKMPWPNTTSQAQ